MIRANDDIEELFEGGIILGVKPMSRYEERPIYLNAGDILCLFTDGVTEAEGKNDEQYETDRLIELIRENRHLPSAEIGDRIIAAVNRFARKDYLYDDLTLIVIKRLAASA